MTTVDEFRTGRAAAWAELQGLIVKRRRTGREVLRLERLHREAVADLAVARRRWPGEGLVDGLESLVAASHAALTAPGRADPAALLAWLRHGFWQALWEDRSWSAGAAVVVLIAAAAGALWVGADRQAGARVVSVSLRREIAAGRFHVPVGPLAAAAAFAAAAAGLVGAFVVLAWVGLELGAAAALAGRDATVPLLAALPLLVGVVVCAGAGASAGWSMVVGDRRDWPARLARSAQVFATALSLVLLFSALGS